jgi:hypothetical protein
MLRHKTVGTIFSPENVGSGGKWKGMKCPHCGKEMEQGTLRSESFIDGAKWLPLAEGRRGKQAIAGTDLLGYVKISGFRCAECRTLVLDY